MATLFAFAGWKRKTEDTTVGEVAAAKNARKDQDEKAVSGLRAAAAAKAAAAGPAGSTSPRSFASRRARLVRRGGLSRRRLRRTTRIRAGAFGSAACSVRAQVQLQALPHSAHVQPCHACSRVTAHVLS